LALQEYSAYKIIDEDTSIMKDNQTTHIHLGLPKTGTTTLQSQLFSNHSQIHYFGKFGEGERLSAARKILNNLRHSVVKCKSGDFLKESIQKQISYAVENNLTPVLSHEGLAKPAPVRKEKQARFLLQNLGACKAILCVREPVSFTKSLYTQRLKSFHKERVGSTPEWIQTLGRPPRYFDINEWLNSVWHSSHLLQNIISYADTAQTYAGVFGKENVKVLTFEQFVRFPDMFITELCNYMEIDAAEGCHLIHKKRANERITTGYVDRIKAIEKSHIKTIWYRKSSRKKKLKILNPENFTGERFEPQIAPEWLEKIHKIRMEQNRHLVSEWGLPLDDYGYRLS